MILETARLILRPWRESDAESLFEFAKDPSIGPVAGWPPHTSVENSLKTIRDVLSVAETYAVVPKNELRAVGSISLKIGENSTLNIPSDEAEIGFWIGVPYWGQGLIPEATKKIIEHAFEDLKLNTVWCTYSDGNEKSRRVQEKCGFTYHHKQEKSYVPPMKEFRTLNVTCLSRDNWRSRDGGKGK